VRVREGGEVLATVNLGRGAFACALSRGQDPRLLVVGQNSGGPGPARPSRWRRAGSARCRPSRTACPSRAERVGGRARRLLPGVRLRHGPVAPGHRRWRRAGPGGECRRPEPAGGSQLPLAGTCIDSRDPGRPRRYWRVVTTSDGGRSWRVAYTSAP